MSTILTFALFLVALRLNNWIADGGLARIRQERAKDEAERQEIVRHSFQFVAPDE